MNLVYINGKSFKNKIISFVIHDFYLQLNLKKSVNICKMVIVHGRNIILQRFTIIFGLIIKRKKKLRMIFTLEPNFRDFFELFLFLMIVIF